MLEDHSGAGASVFALKIMIIWASLFPSIPNFPLHGWTWPELQLLRTEEFLLHVGWDSSWGIAINWGPVRLPICGDSVLHRCNHSHPYVNGEEQIIAWAYTLASPLKVRPLQISHALSIRPRQYDYIDSLFLQFPWSCKHGNELWRERKCLRLACETSAVWI